MEPFKFVVSSTTLYAKINNEVVWHKYEIHKLIDPKVVSFADSITSLVFTTSTLNGEFKLMSGTYDEVSYAYDREILISVDNGFSRSDMFLSNINITMNIPMKALPFGKGKTTFPCYYQPKINGGRCISTKFIDIFNQVNINLTSKEGHDLPIEHITEQLFPIYDMFGSPIFDGEIYLYGEKCTSINGAARNPKNSIHDKLAFVIFDIILYGVSQFVRTKILNSIREQSSASIDDMHYSDDATLHLHNNKGAIGKIFFLETNVVDNEEVARTLAEWHIKYGYEGIILRNPEAVYQQGKHVGNLTKIKKQLEGMFRIVDILPKPIETDQPLFKLQNDITDEIFDCNPVGSKESLRKYVSNWKDYIGKMVKVTYYERTINNLPFHANVYPEVMADYDDNIRNSAFEDFTPTINDCNIDDL